MPRALLDHSLNPLHTRPDFVVVLEVAFNDRAKGAADDWILAIEIRRAMPAAALSASSCGYAIVPFTLSSWRVRCFTMASTAS
jgi:hypothetical protein